MNRKYRISSETSELFYHCVTRNIAGQFLFGEKEKAVLRSMMQKVADFCGIDVLTYCIMSNHLHILCRVPPARFSAIDDAELMRRYRVLFSDPSKYRPYKPEVLEQWLKSGSPRGVTARNLLMKRMHNISMFMKILKLRFSIWFNKTHGRFGTLWAEKFKSIVVEGRGNPLLRMAQYIDLNPVRAGMAESSVKYPFCGIADAWHGLTAARNGIQTIAEQTCPTVPESEAVSWYEEHLSVTLREQPTRTSAIDRDRNNLPVISLLQSEERFCKSLAMGSHEFLSRLIKLFGPAFCRRSHDQGPQNPGILVNEPVFFGRKERPRKKSG